MPNIIEPINLEVASFNVNSLPKRIDEVTNYIIRNNIHIMALNETKFNSIKNSTVSNTSTKTEKTA